MNEPDDTAMVTGALYSIAGELQLIRLSLFALCPDKDRKALIELIKEADTMHKKGLQEMWNTMFSKESMSQEESDAKDAERISDAMFPTERMTR